MRSWLTRAIAACVIGGSAVVMVPLAAHAGFGACTYNIAPGSVAESAGSSGGLTVTRTGSFEGASTVSYSTSNGTAEAGSDYTAVSQQVLNFATQGSQTATVTIADDALVESSETLTLTLGNATGCAIGTGSATLTITDNDVEPTTTTAAPTTTTTTTTAPSTTTSTTPPCSPPIVLSASVVPAGGTDVATACGFGAGTTGQIFLLSEPVLLTTAVANAAGEIQSRVTIPRGTIAGIHSIEVRGVDPTGAPRVVSAQIRVTAAAVRGATLAVTGGWGAADAARVAMVLVAAGLALIAEGRRRRFTPSL